MNAAVWKKTTGDSAWMLVLLAVLVYVFAIVFVWISSMIPVDKIVRLIEELPPLFQQFVPIEAQQLFDVNNRLAVAFEHPIVLLAVGIWTIARASDVVAGELGRGTLEVILAQPVRRIEVLTSHAVVTVAGAAVLAASCWLGIATGAAVVEFSPEALAQAPITMARFTPAALNLFALGVFFAGVTSLASAWDHQRWRPIAVVFTLYVVSELLKFVGRALASEKGDSGGGLSILPAVAPVAGEERHWLEYLSFMSSFEPIKMVADPAGAWVLSRDYDGTLIGIALAAYVLAAVVFCRRDLPAPV